MYVVAELAASHNALHAQQARCPWPDPTIVSFRSKMQNYRSSVPGITPSRESRVSGPLIVRQPAQTVDFAFRDKAAGVAFVGVGEWEIKIDSEGIRVVWKGAENSLGGSIAHRIEFGQILSGKAIFNVLEGRSLRRACGNDASRYVDDQRLKIAKLRNRVKVLEDSLEEKEERLVEKEDKLEELEVHLERKDEDIEEMEDKLQNMGKILRGIGKVLGKTEAKLEQAEENLEEAKENLGKMEDRYVQEMRQGTIWKKEVERVRKIIVPLSRRSLLDKARDLILLYYYHTRHNTQILENLITDDNDAKLSRYVQGQFVKSLHKGDPDALFQDVHDVLTKFWPELNLDVIKMACGTGNQVRQAGNEAAHEFNRANVYTSLHVNTEDLDDDDLGTLKDVYRWWTSGRWLRTRNSVGNDVMIYSW
ncbi:hypothetical protein BDN72DRAFT_219927 [Pluteus cervinus]|uniref:Uncharacterized protein n=1 Tax=Pluteus cervinus TaxID=181527 RepID=A0ACD3AHH4_9AGAR|nr:hypothetical protein BDN72DRAFT_219927 [Pluteus cervinus]